MESHPSITSVADAALYRQSRYNPLQGLTAQSLTTMRTGFDGGYLRAFANLGEVIMDIDDTGGTVVDKRCGKAAHRPWDVLIGEDVRPGQKAQAKRHQDALKYFYSNLSVRNPVELNQSGSMTLLLQQMMRAAFLKYSAHEIAWQPGPGGLTAELWHVPLSFMEATQGQLRYAGALGITPGRVLDPHSWLIAVHHRCLMKAMAVLYLFKKLSLSDWVNFSEKFGTPALHLETTATPGSKEWNESVVALAQFGRDWELVTSPGQKLNLIQANATGEGPFAPMVDRCDRALVRVAMGSDLSTMSRENGAGASMQGDETDDLVNADCKWLSETLNKTLSQRVIDYNFGEGTIPLAFFNLAGPQRDDTELQMKVDDHVSKNGVKLSPEDIAERYGRTHNVELEKAEEPEEEEPAPAANEAPKPKATPKAGKKGARLARQKQRVQDVLKLSLKEAAEQLARIEAASDPEEARAALADMDVDELEALEELEDSIGELVAAEFLAGLAGDGPRDDEEEEDEPGAANEGPARFRVTLDLPAANEAITPARFEVSERGVFLPFGEYPHSAGLQIVDAQAGHDMAADLTGIMGRVRRLGMGAPVYIGHPDHHDPAVKALNLDKRAYGWCKSVEVQADGILFPVKWNRLGKELLEDGQFAYHTPYWLASRITHQGKPGIRPARLVSIGLTNNPNIPVPPILIP